MQWVQLTDKLNQNVSFYVLNKINKISSSLCRHHDRGRNAGYEKGARQDQQIRQVGSNGLVCQLAESVEEKEIYRYCTLSLFCLLKSYRFLFLIADDKGHEKLLNEVRGVESANYKLRCLVWVNFPMIYTQVWYLSVEITQKTLF